MFLNRESLDQVSNSKAPFCLCVRLSDGGTAAREQIHFGRAESSTA